MGYKIPADHHGPVPGNRVIETPTVQKTNEAMRALSQVVPESPYYLTDTLTGVSRLQDVCYGLSVRAGWWNGTNARNPETFATKLCLIHSEISEAMEGGRKRLKDTHLPHRDMAEVELADAAIRIFDLAGAMGYDLAGAIMEKLAYNQQRADHKPEARAAEGGKSF
jgi:NTP pyrophosphatase (non-canonical NTP hydrolase)